MIRGVWNVYREAVRLDADLYHFHDPELLPVGLLLRMRGRVVVYDVHEDVSEDIARKHYIPKGFRRLSARAVSLIETLSARLFSAVVPATPTIARRFASRHLRKVVLSNYPVLEEFHAADPVAWPCRSPAIAYVGVMSRDRCIVEMAQAMSLLPEGLQASLKLVGNFSPPSLVEELSVLKGWNRTQVMGILDRPGVARVLADVRAGLVVLKPTPAFLASIPIKMFEYMCAGIPVIASNFPGFAEVVDGAKCGLLVDPGDPRAIAQAIEFVLTHPDEAEEMGERGREAVVTKYNWASEERKLIQLYGTLLDSPCAA
jgi:glycosyltransferase involved in cell wall biosynthesis